MMQYVDVQFRSSPGKSYAYQWDGEKELKLGDRVVVPANWINPMPSFADVVLIYAGREHVQYRGPLAEIMGVVNEDGSD